MILARHLGTRVGFKSYIWKGNVFQTGHGMDFDFPFFFSFFFMISNGWSSSGLSLGSLFYFFIIYNCDSGVHNWEIPALSKGGSI